MNSANDRSFPVNGQKGFQARHFVGTLVKMPLEHRVSLAPIPVIAIAVALSRWQDTLDHRQFVRMHKSYIVNVAKIVKVTGNQIYLADQTVVPIGRAYRDEFTRKSLR